MAVTPQHHPIENKQCTMKSTQPTSMAVTPPNREQAMHYEVHPAHLNGSDTTHVGPLAGAHDLAVDHKLRSL